MKYTVSTESLGNSFILPVQAADKWLKLATHTQLKVLLLCFRNLANGIDENEISNRLGISAHETVDALTFWAQAGLLKSEETSGKSEQKQIISKTEMPTRQDVIRRGMEDENVKFLMRQAQVSFGRNLKQNEASYLVFLYDDCGMDAAVILYLLSYAANCKKCNLQFIKKVAENWLKKGVETVSQAERAVSETVKEDLAWAVVMRAFGIEKRNPSENEKTLSNEWINNWEISPDLLKAAYDVCVDTKSKFSFAYTAKIIEQWHKKGVKTPEDAKKENKKGGKKAAKRSFAAFDIEEFEKSLDED